MHYTENWPLSVLYYCNYKDGLFRLTSMLHFTAADVVKIFAPVVQLKHTYLSKRYNPPLLTSPVAYQYLGGVGAVDGDGIDK